MTDNLNSLDDVTSTATPALPTFAAGEQKTAHLTWEMVDGVMQLGVETVGFQDDLNQLGMMLAFTLEKLLDSSTATPEVNPNQ